MSTLSPVTPTLAAELTRWRRDFHRHPELGFCEFRTAAIVAATRSSSAARTAAS